MKKFLLIIAAALTLSTPTNAKKEDTTIRILGTGIVLAGTAGLIYYYMQSNKIPLPASANIEPQPQSPTIIIIDNVIPVQQEDSEKNFEEPQPETHPVIVPKEYAREESLLSQAFPETTITNLDPVNDVIEPLEITNMPERKTALPKILNNLDNLNIDKILKKHLDVLKS